MRRYAQGAFSTRCTEGACGGSSLVCVLAALELTEVDGLANLVLEHMKAMSGVGVACVVSFREVKDYLSSEAFVQSFDHMTRICACQAEDAIDVLRAPVDISAASDVRMHSGIMSFFLAPNSSARVWSVDHDCALRLNDFATSPGGEDVSDEEWQQLTHRVKFVDACPTVAGQCCNLKRFSISAFAVVDTFVVHHLFVGECRGERTCAFIAADDISTRHDFARAMGTCSAASSGQEATHPDQIFMFDASSALTDGARGVTAFSYILFLACVRFRVASDASLPFDSILNLNDTDTTRVAYHSACVAHVAHGRCAVSHDRGVRLMEELNRPDARNLAQIYGEINDLSLKERVFSGFPEPNIASVVRQHIVRLTDIVDVYAKRDAQRGVLLVAQTAALHFMSHPPPRAESSVCHVASTRDGPPDAQPPGTSAARCVL